ncbi:MAG: efflux RND transporter permease subunit [Planctomycetota bacterium]|nr:MAG: efflux RND transporter permease subunit [Planctomycetota bacterium]
MKGIVAWFVRNPVAANLLMATIVVTGLFTAPALRQEIVPTIEVDAVQVTVPYPGASPEEVEEAICMRIEEAVQGLSGVDEIHATAEEGVGTVMIDLLDGQDRNQMLSDIQAEIDRIDTFPADAEEPVVSLVDVNLKVLTVMIWGDADEAVLRRVADELREDLGALPELSLVRLSNARPYEISIEVAEEALRRYRLSFDEVAAAVRRASLDLPGGSVKARGGEVLLRTRAQAYRGEEFAALPLRTGPDGTLLRIGDVAEVVDGFADTDQSTRFNGRPAVALDVFRVGDQDALAISRVVREHLAEKERSLPPGLHLDVTGDETSILRDRLDLMLRNGRAGLILVLLSLALFLRLRLALWVTVGIPISFLGAIALMPVFEVSINLISLFAFIIVLGIVVDDAIVVAENVHDRRLGGASALEAAVRGTQEMTGPVIFAVLTTIVAFLPLLLMPGSMGQYSRNIPLIVVAVLTFSLVEALLVLPAHLRHLPSEDPDRHWGFWGRLQGRTNAALEWLRDRLFLPSLRWAVSWRWFTLAAALAILTGSLGLVASGRVKFIFFPEIEADNVAVELTMPLGTPLSRTEQAIARFEEVARSLQQELVTPDGEPEILTITTSIGGQPYRERQSNMGSTQGRSYAGAHLAEVNLELLTAERRVTSSKEIARLWQERSGPVPGAEELSFTADLTASDADVDLELTGPDLDQLLAAAEEVQAELARWPGVLEVRDDFRRGKREWKLTLTPEGRALGLTEADLARQVRQAFYGEEAQSIQRGRDEVKVWVRYPLADRRTLASLADLRLRLPGGAELPFSRVARVVDGRGFSTIHRRDRRRSVGLLVDLDTHRLTPDQAVGRLEEEVLPRLRARHPGLGWEFSGQQKEQSDFMGSLLRLFGVALFAIYALLAIPLKSYGQPLVIMSAIPFGFVGAVWGHVLMGMNLAIFSVIGLTALAGVVVNDSLVLLDYINRLRAEGMPLAEAIPVAGRRRFRPILLTTLTTFLGLTPLLLEKSMQARFLIPMAVSLGFGVVFATFITLVLVPCLLLAATDLGRLLPRRRP